MSEIEDVAQLDIVILGEPFPHDDTKPNQSVTISGENEVAVGVITQPPYNGLIFVFPKDNSAIIFQGNALERVVGSIDFLLHEDVESVSDEGMTGEALLANKKVTLLN